MVYCGRPSTGCGNCKKRRIKCDESRPQCKHCIKTDRECPGYPAEIDLLLRKEEPGRRRKAKKAPSESDVPISSGKKRSRSEIDCVASIHAAHPTKRPRRSSDIVTHGSRTFQWVQVHGPRANSVPDIVQQVKLETSIEEEATDVFVGDSVLSPQCTEPAGNLRKPAIAHVNNASPLSLAFEAVSMAIAASPASSEYAASAYGKALLAMQQVMQDPLHATSNDTLLATLLFALYESIVSSEHSLAAWYKHIEGAIAIIKTRGLQQLNDIDALRKFRAMRAQLFEDLASPAKAFYSGIDCPNTASEILLDQSCSTVNIDPLLLTDGVADAG